MRKILSLNGQEIEVRMLYKPKRIYRIHIIRTYGVLWHTIEELG